jgi:two-component system sensor histidine kinase YesM
MMSTNRKDSNFTAQDHRRGIRRYTRGFTIKLRTQLLFMFILITLVTLGIGSAFLYSSMLTMLQGRSEEAIVGSFRQVDYSLGAFRSKVDSISKSFLLSPSFDRFLQDDVEPGMKEIELIDEMKSKMTELIYSYPYIRSIYLFTDDGRVTGINSSGIIYRKGVGDHPFYKSEARVLAEQLDPQLVWTGGERVADYDRSFRYSADPSFGDVLLSASRRLQPFNGQGRAGTLVINVDEAEIYVAYSNLAINRNSLVYIIDGKGRIISGDRKAVPLGQPMAIFSRMNGSTGSFTEQGHKGDRQIIYYRLPGTEWTICMEIPLAEYTSDINRMRSTILYIALISLAIAAIASFFWTRTLTRPFYTLLKGMRTLEQGNLGVSIPEHPGSEIGILIREFNTMSGSIRDLMRQQQRIEQEKREAELQVLQAHIQPHFLFNTLNTIKWMAIAANATPIMESITALGNLIRPIFKKTSILIPLQEELEYLRHYMTIMNSRYGEGAVLRIEIDDVLSEATIPRLLLQPLIENSLIHGLESRQYKGIITIKGIELQGNMLLQVSDDGIGIDQLHLDELGEQFQQNFLEHNGADRDQIGLHNVNSRIRLHYGDYYGMSILSLEGQGTTVTLRLPLVTKS